MTLTPSVVELFKKRFPDVTKEKAHLLSTHDKKVEIFRWWREHAGGFGLRAGDWNILVDALKAQGIHLPLAIRIFAAAKLKIPAKIIEAYDLDKAEDVTEALRVDGIDPVFVYFQQHGLNAREIADIVQENLDVFSPLLPKLFTSGRFLEVRDILHQRGVTAASKDPHRKIKFLCSYESGIPGEVTALEGDHGNSVYSDDDRMVVFVNDKRSRIVTVQRSDEDRVWKFAVSMSRVAWLASTQLKRGSHSSDGEA